MKTYHDAQAVANYFVEISNRNSGDLTLLKLIKLVYIAYGFGLALFDRSIIDYRFDKVEAWKFGPVIPSVYHSFKHNGSNRIAESVSFIVSENYETETPNLDGQDDVKKLCDFVWRNYGYKPSSELVNILHNHGTPWRTVYEEGKNVDIPEWLTKDYYKSFVQYIKKTQGV